MLHGRDVTGVPPFDRDVNTVFQDYALFPHMTVGDNVAYGLVVRSVPASERRSRVADAMRMVRLDGYEARRPAQLSGGQRQRVALARALVNRPRVLLLDEPLGALDLKLREEMQIELKAIQAQVGITFIYVTHDQEEALTMSNRIAVFNLGRIEQIGTPADVYEHPATTFVAGFVGTSNLLTGETARVVLGTDGVFTVRPEKIRIADPDEAPADDEGSALGRDPGRGLHRSGYAVHRGARDRQRARRHPAEPADIVDGGALRGRSSRPARLEASPRAEPGDQPGDGGIGGRTHMRHLRVPAVMAVLVLLLAACGGEEGGEMLSEIGEPEGELNLVIWAGYAEDGSAFPEFDWVTPFEEETGCIVNAQTQADSATGVRMLQSGEFDGGSFSGNATDRLMAAGDVAPVNVELLENYANVFEGLKNQPHNSLDGQPYGVPHGRGPNLLAWNTEEVEAQTTWDGIWENAADYEGQLSIFDSPDFIADAALHLMATQPDLGITNPYQLTQEQFDASIALLEELVHARPAVLGWQHVRRPDHGVRRRRRHDRHDLAVPGEQPRGGGGADRGDQARGGLDGLVGHVDDRQRGGQPELHVPVDGPHDVGRGERPGDGVLRRGADEPGSLRLRRDDRSGPLRADPCDRRGVLGGHLVLEHRARGLRRRRRRTRRASTTTPGSRHGPPCAAAEHPTVDRIQHRCAPRRSPLPGERSSLTDGS